MRVSRLVFAVIMVAAIVFVIVGNRKQEPVSYAYNPAAEVHLAGVVQEVQEFYCPVTDDRGAHLLLQTERGPVMVHVSIARFLRAHEFSFKPGERIEVQGAKVKFKGGESVIAREIMRGQEKFIFRDAVGNPVWKEE